MNANAEIWAAALWTALMLILGFVTGRYVAALLEKIGKLRLEMIDALFRWKYEDRIRNAVPRDPGLIEREIHGPADDP
mgnify:CR=1 FL=1